MNCLVCNLPIGKTHNYYGCIGVCSSCRNFFRRSVTSGNYKYFYCPIRLLEGQLLECLIDSKFRQSCKKCRFKRCLEAGMETKYILNNKVCNSAPQCLQVQEHLSPTPTLKFTQEEFLLCQNLEKILDEAIYKVYYSAFYQDSQYFLDWIRISNSEAKILPYELVKKMEDVDEMLLTESAFQYLNLEDLSEKEKSWLVQTNIKNLIGLMWALLSHSPDVYLFTKQLVSYGQAHCDNEEIRTVLPFLQQLQLNQKPLLCVYDAVYSSPWAPNNQIEEEHQKITTSLSRWIRKSEDQASDPFLRSLVMIITVLSCQDSNIPKNIRTKIEACQLKYVTLLQRYLRLICPKEAAMKFGCGLMMVQYAKELFKLHSQRLPF